MPIRPMKSILEQLAGAGGLFLTVFSFQINEVMHLYDRAAKLKPSALPVKGPFEPQDRVTISREGRKRQVQDGSGGVILAPTRKV